MTDISVANRYADSNCDICEGEGTLSTFDGDSEYCLCVKENLAEAKGEMQFELAYGN